MTKYLYGRSTFMIFKLWLGEECSKAQENDQSQQKLEVM
jgi:hypothetical protein